MQGALGLLFAALIGADGAPPPPPLPSPVPKVEIPGTTLVSEAQEIWGLSLPEAIRISLDSSEVVRLISGSHPGILIPCEGQPPVRVRVGGPLIDDEWDGTSPLVIGRVQGDLNQKKQCPPRNFRGGHRG